MAETAMGSTPCFISHVTHVVQTCRAAAQQHKLVRCSRFVQEGRSRLDLRSLLRAAMASATSGPELQFPFSPSVIQYRLRFYYAIGNTPAQNLLVRYSDAPLATDYDVLCLGCGDLRHCLFSLAGLVDVFKPGTLVELHGLTGSAHLNGQRGKIEKLVKDKGRYKVSLPKSAGGTISVKPGNLMRLGGDRCQQSQVHFFLNDVDPHVIARNLLLLECMLDLAVPLETSFALWFSMGLTDSQWQTCMDKITCLINRCMGPDDAPVQGCCFDNDSGRSWSQVLEAWRKWLVMAGHSKEASGKAAQLPSHAEVLQMRRNTLSVRCKQPGKSSVFDPMPRHAVTVDELQKSIGGVVHGHLLKWDLPLCHKSILEMRLSQTAEVEEHLLSGNFNVATAPYCRTNATLFWRSDKYDLHYGTNAYDAFPRFAADAAEPLLSLCFAEFCEWVSALRLRSHLVRWTVSTADCRHLAVSTERLFDVVTSSNLVDHIGLMNLLATSRACLKDFGVLYTNSLTWNFDKETGKQNDSMNELDFVRQQLPCLGVHSWPQLVGCRLMGFESPDVRPVSSQFQSEEVAALRAGLAERGADFAFNRELNLVWVAVPRAEYSSPEPAVTAGRSEKMFWDGGGRMSPFAENVRAMVSHLGRPAGFGSFVLTHPGSVLPHLARTLGSEEIRAIGEGLEWTVLCDLLLCQSGQELKDKVRLNSVQVPYMALNAAWESQPLVFVRVVGVDGGAHMYYGSWHHCDDERDVVTLYFFSCKFPPGAHVEVCSLHSGMKIADGLALREEDLSMCEVNRMRCRFGFPQLDVSQDNSDRPGSFSIVSDEHGQVTFRLVDDRVAKSLAGGTGGLRIRSNNSPFEFEITDCQSTVSTASGKALLKFTYAYAPLRAEEAIFSFEDIGVVQVKRSAPAPVLLRIRKRPFQGIVRRLTHNTFLNMEGCYPPQSMVTLSGAQFNDEERYISRSREDSCKPPLVNLKDSFMFFYQCNDKLMNISQNEQGVVALIVRHSMPTHRNTGVPWVDLSVSFLTHDNVGLLAPQYQNLPGLKRSIIMNQAEYELFQQVFEVFELQCFAPGGTGGGSSHGLLKDGHHTGRSTGVAAAVGAERGQRDELCGLEREHPELRQLFPEESQRRHFRRALVAPLYARLVELGHLKEREKTLPKKADSSETMLESVKACKEHGNRFFGRQQWDDAMTCYRRAINLLNSGSSKSRAAEDEEALSLELAAVCSNMALCCLKLKDHQEAVIAAENALKHLGKCGKAHQIGALAKKIWSRKAEGHEGLGQLVEAEKARQRVPK